MALIHETIRTAAFAALGRPTVEDGFGDTTLRGMFAGWLIALTSSSSM